MKGDKRVTAITPHITIRSITHSPRRQQLPRHTAQHPRTVCMQLGCQANRRVQAAGRLWRGWGVVGRLWKPESASLVTMIGDSFVFGSG